MDDFTGCTALHVAAQHGQESCVQLLLLAGADPNVRDKNGLTPLYYAALHKHAGVVRLFVAARECDLHSVNNNKRTALHAAALAGSLEVVQILVTDGRLSLSAKDEFGLTPCDVAGLEGHSLVEWWLRKQENHTPATNSSSLTIMVSFSSFSLCIRFFLYGTSSP